LAKTLTSGQRAAGSGQQKNGKLKCPAILKHLKVAEQLTRVNSILWMQGFFLGTGIARGTAVILGLMISVIPSIASVVNRIRRVFSGALSPSL
jgi:hypothetical protein